MAKPVKRQCPQCKETKEFRADQKTCGCRPEKPVMQEASEVDGNKWSISLPQTRIHTLDDLIDFFEIDLSIWEVKKFIANKWEVGSKNKADDLVIAPLYQVKAWLEKKVEIVDAKAEIESLKKSALEEVKRIPIVIRKADKSSGNLLEIDIADHHFGKLAWAAETGNQNYDTKIATKLFKKAFQTILTRVSALTFDEIWFVVGNDLLNSDNAQGTTTRGTVVATDARYQKTFSIVRQVMTECIETLRPLAKKVKVIMVSGNHDQLSVWHLGDSLECFFNQYNDVEIDNTPKYYKYHRFGQVMIMYTHGDKGKRKNYPLMMATEQPEMFGNTKFREVHTGHRHTLEVEEQHGIRVRTMSALCPADSWHAENGYVGNLRAAEAFIWNKDEGLIGTAVYTDNRQGYRGRMTVRTRQSPKEATIFGEGSLYSQ